MKTNYKTILIFIPIITLCLVFWSCDNPLNNEPIYKGMITGCVYDDSTRNPISLVKVWAEGIDTTYTNDSGKFKYSIISMPSSEYRYLFVFNKSGYNNKTVSIVMKSGIETRLDSVLMKRVY